MNEKPQDDRVAYRARVKYDEKTARKYFHRDPQVHAREMRMLDRVMRFVPKTNRVLDVPCGGGRVTVHLSQQGYLVESGDLSDSMIALAQRNIAEHELNCPVRKLDIERLDLADRSYDTIVCFRFFHHLPNPDFRRRVVGELCRVAAQSVVMSYFNPVSLAALERKLRARRKGKPLEECDTPQTEVVGYFHERGFELVENCALRPLIHNLHTAVFQKAKPGA